MTTHLFQAWRAGPLLIAATALAGCGMQTMHTSSTLDTATYRCDNGMRIHTRYFPPDRAQVHIHGRRIDMHIARSADGARYVGGGLTWWTKGVGPGSHGMLLSHDAGTQHRGELITRCRQIAD